MTTGSPRRSLSRRSALELASASLAALLILREAGTVEAADPATLSRHREIVRRLFTDGVNAGDDALMTSFYVPTGAGSDAGEPMTAAGMPIPLPDFHRAMPGVQALVDALVAEGDLVAALVTWRGPHPPAGTHIEGQTMHLFRFDQDQIAEQWATGWEWLAERGIRPVCNLPNPLLAP